MRTMRHQLVAMVAMAVTPVTVQTLEMAAKADRVATS
jgi:hypothetical protein